MSLLGLFFDKPQNVEIAIPDSADTERQLLILDMARNISHDHSATPTDNPVEDSSPSIITDHVDVLPDVLTFEGTMSEAPISLKNALIGNVAGAVGAIAPGGGAGRTIFTGALSALGGALLGEDNRVLDAHNTMLDIRNKKIPVTITTELKTYSNMILSKYNPIQTPTIGKSLNFTATFREIRVVKSETIPVPARALDTTAQASGASVQNQGKKPTKTTERGESLATTITGVGA